jgi:acyl dehydratase
MAFDPARALGLRHGPVPLEWSAGDARRYAIAVGARAELPLLPTYAATLARAARPDFRELGVDPARVLHLSQALEVQAVLPVPGQALGETEVTAVQDAGSRGAILEVRTRLRAGSGGAALATATARYLARGAGGFGGSPPPAREAVDDPARPPDVTLACPTRADQALLYRLLGDANPLHVDPAAARAAGFERPILHGLCTYGIVGLAVVSALCDDDAARLTGLSLDFRAPVYPGETLRFEAWRDAAGANLRLTAPGRGEALLSRGRCSFASAARASDPR